MKKMLKIFLVLICCLIGIIIFALVFIKIHKSFGDTPNQKDKEDYAKRSEIFKDGKFVNTGKFTVMSNWDDPVDRFSRYAKEKNVEYITPILGETVNLKNYKDYQNEWR
jgi:uncharacterized protein YxeA